MKRSALFVLLAMLGSGACAQAVSTISAQTCNVALSQCTLTDTSGNSVVVHGQWVYSGTVSMDVVTPGGAQPTRTCVASRTLVSQTLYKIIDDLTITCGDGSSLTGTYSATRSGSGRGGWAWHSHVSFETLTLY